MEGHDQGTIKKVIQCQHVQRSDTQAVWYKMSYDDIQNQAGKQLQKSWTNNSVRIFFPPSHSYSAS